MVFAAKSLNEVGAVGAMDEVVAFARRERKVHPVLDFRGTPHGPVGERHSLYCVLRQDPIGILQPAAAVPNRKDNVIADQADIDVLRCQARPEREGVCTSELSYEIQTVAAVVDVSVVSFAAVEEIAARAAYQEVIAVIPGETVVAGASVEGIVAPQPDQSVVAAEAFDKVRSLGPEDEVVAFRRGRNLNQAPLYFSFIPYRAVGESHALDRILSDSAVDDLQGPASIADGESDIVEKASYIDLLRRDTRSECDSVDAAGIRY